VALHFAGGVAAGNTAQLLFQVLGANHAITTDQQFTKMFIGATWVPLSITDTWVSGAFNTACTGGMYTAAAKGGTAIVAAAQSYAALTGAGTALNAAIAASGPFNNITPFFSLTVANGAALTGNVYIWGVIIG
jgi:hypothetical protein